MGAAHRVPLGLRVDAPVYLPEFLVGTGACARQADARGLAELQPTLLAADAIAQAPALRAVRRDAQFQAGHLGVTDDVAIGTRLQRFHGSGGQ